MISQIYNDFFPNFQATSGLFGAKPATSAFGTTPASTGFGGFGSGLFGKPQQTTAPTFGSTAPSEFKFIYV